MSATVYFSPVITPEKVLDMFKLVDKTLPGNIAIKLHSGEKGNQNFLGPEFWKPVIDSAAPSWSATLPMTAPATPPRSTAS